MDNQFEMPEDVDRLSDEHLEEHLAAAVREFGRLANSDSVTVKDFEVLASLKDSIAILEQQKLDRITAATEMAAKIEALKADVFGKSETEVIEPVAEAEAEPVAETEVIEPTAVISASGRRAYNLAAVRAKNAGTPGGLSRYLPSDSPVDSIEITASVDVPGYRPGQQITLSQVTEGAMRRAQALKTGNGGTSIIANYRLPFPEELIVKDSSSAPEGSTAIMAAADQHRLPKGDLVASGGWCAPSETVYTITDIACPDMLWNVPEVQLNRGGLRFFRTPALDVAAMTWVWTETQDIAAAPPGGTGEKPCYVIPCPAPIDVRAIAVGVCLSVGILTQRFFPEMVDWYVRNSMVAHEIRIKQAMYAQAIAGIPAANQVTIRTSFAAFSAVYEAVALQAADMIERFNLCDSTQLEVVFPWWAKNLFLSDLMRQDGSPQESVRATEALIVDLFRELGVSVQFARGLPPAVPASIGGATPVTTWPAQVQFMIYPAGNFQIGRGPDINLGVIIDSTTLKTNDEKMFSEEAVVLIDRMGLARLITVDVCPDGTVGARNTTALCA